MDVQPRLGRGRKRYTPNTHSGSVSVEGGAKCNLETNYNESPCGTKHKVYFGAQGTGPTGPLEPLEHSRCLSLALARSSQCEPGRFPRQPASLCIRRSATSER